MTIDDETNVKVMLNLHEDLCKRCTNLQGFLGSRSLRGTATRADVMRHCLAVGLDALEEKAHRMQAISGEHKETARKYNAPCRLT